MMDNIEDPRIQRADDPFGVWARDDAERRQYACLLEDCMSSLTHSYDSLFGLSYEDRLSVCSHWLVKSPMAALGLAALVLPVSDLIESILHLDDSLVSSVLSRALLDGYISESDLTEEELSLISVV